MEIWIELNFHAEFNNNLSDFPFRICSIESVTFAPVKRTACRANFPFRQHFPPSKFSPSYVGNLI